MASRVFVTSVALALAVPLAAQQPVSAPIQSLKYQMETFEVVLQSAVRHGGDQLAQKASAVMPNVELFGSEALARGWLMPNGLMFTVQVPAVRETVVWLLQQNRPAVPVVPGSDRSRVVANGLPTPDPMTVGAVPTSAPFNFEVEYTKGVRDALVDAMLENSAPLPIKADDWLVVAANDGEGPPPGLMHDPHFTMYLRIRGSDLAAYHAKQITKEEAIKRVEMIQF